jgi:hypothetical protein
MIYLLKKRFKEDDNGAEIVLAFGDHRSLDQVIHALLNNIVGQSPLPGFLLVMLDCLPNGIDNLLIAKLVEKAITYLINIRSPRSQLRPI